jgi:hypothetical protein
MLYQDPVLRVYAWSAGIVITVAVCVAFAG